MASGLPPLTLSMTTQPVVVGGDVDRADLGRDRRAIGTRVAGTSEKASMSA